MLGGQHIIFSLERIKDAGFLASIVFDNSHVTKIHDSLPMQLFAPLTFAVVLHRQWMTQLYWLLVSDDKCYSTA
jgi:hypothetical protein